MRTLCKSVWTALALGLAASPAVARSQGASPRDEGPLPATERAPKSEAMRPLRIGAIGGLGFPRPLAIEGMVLLGDTVALGAEYGVLPELTVDGVHTSLWSLAGDVRFFPFHSPFFVGVRAGRQHIGADTTITVAPYGSSSESLSIDSWFVNPRIGLLWTSGAGLALGMEAGFQVPVATDSTSSMSLAFVPAAQGTANWLGTSILPTVDLLRIGMLF
jgi:hypothetical protein